MLTWQKSPLDWYAHPRSERAFMKAVANAKGLVEAMVAWDQREESKREAKLEAELAKRRGRR